MVEGPDLVRDTLALQILRVYNPAHTDRQTGTGDSRELRSMQVTSNEASRFTSAPASSPIHISAQDKNPAWLPELFSLHINCRKASGEERAAAGEVFTLSKSDGIQRFLRLKLTIWL